MKYLLIILLGLSLIGCQNQETEPAELTPESQKEEPDLILGDWRMDSSAFINDGIKALASPPILPTTWTFKADGFYQVKNSMTMTGTFSRTNDSLFVILMAVPNEYEILLLNETSLYLRSTIVETDETSMKTEAYLTRKEN